MNFFEEQENFRKLAKIYSEDTSRLVVFCGAGASREAGMPSWDELVALLLKAYLDIATTGLGQKIAEERALQVESARDNWQRMSMLKEFMGEQYEQTIGAVLRSDSGLIPSFYRNIWDLNPNALLTFNLDGFANNSYVNRKTGKLQSHIAGIDAPHSRVGLGDGRPLIVDLHGNIDSPRTWILTKEERDNLLRDTGYIEFLKSMFSHNLVIFYGVGIRDFSVSGQLSYLRELDFVTGKYFLVKKSNEKGDADIVNTLPVNIVYTGEDKSWEEGFSDFIGKLRTKTSRDENALPVLSNLATDKVIPSPDDLINTLQTK